MESLESTPMATKLTLTFTKTLLLVLMALVSLVSPADIPPENRNEDLVVAISEMQRANYFTFVFVLNMARFDPRLRGNVTFLMPNDRMLSKISLSDHAVTDFLLRHSIPSPLLFDYLQHMPTGSIIPSSEPDYALKISNNGRRSFFLNNVKLISPNLCTASSSIRCHGIDGVLSLVVNNNSTAVTSPPCSNTSNSNPLPPAIPPFPAPFPPLSGPNGLNLTPAAGPIVSPPKSGSSSASFSTTCGRLTCLMVSILVSSLFILL